MKQVLDAAGIRTPRHRRASTAREVRDSAEEVGFPVCVKPIAGAGSADTYRVGDEGELEQVLERIGHVPEVSVEEFIEGEEYTFDTICAGGRILYHNVAWYRPRPLIARSEEWISPQTVSLRAIEAPQVAPGIEMGQAVLEALGFCTGFTHMEWFLKDDGEAVFGEIGARPPGARSVDIMNYASDVDVYTGWAEAVVHGRFSQEVERKYNAAVIFKRAQGEGHIRHIEGLEPLLRELGSAIVCVDLLPVGAPRRNWRATLISDGYLIVRHHDLQTTMAMADRVGTDLQIYAV
jgi:biotin carboxylase